MVLLLTNDDGIDSLGIWALKKALDKEHQVWVVAPEGDRSGTSHSLTFRDPVRFKKLEHQVYSCNGTPADCVFYTFLGAIAVKPDMIISGINRGPNLGTDILLSGTAAAARQAALCGVPGVAVSAVAEDDEKPLPFEYAAEFIQGNLLEFYNLWNRHHFININVPSPGVKVPGVSITHPSVRVYTSKIDRYTAPNGDTYVFLVPQRLRAMDEEGSDWNAITAGNISVSPVYLHPLNQDEDQAYLEAEFRKPKHERRF